MRIREQLQESRNPLRFASWFSGGGTLEAALRPVQHVHAVEYDPEIAAHYHAAHGFQPTVASVLGVSPHELYRANPDHFHASPSCKSFSSARIHPPTEADYAHDQACNRHVKDAIAVAKPPTCTVENVPAYFRHPLGASLKTHLEDLGYTTDYHVHNPTMHGGAMSRRRGILRASRIGSLPDVPPETGPTTWQHAIQGLEPHGKIAISGSTRKYMNQAPAHEFPMLYMGHTDAFALRNSPAPSLTASPASVPRIVTSHESTEADKLSARQMARLMGLPDRYKLPERWSLAKTILGNGIHGATTRTLIDPMLRR